MDYKTKLSILSLATLVTAIIAFFLSRPIRSGFCGRGDTGCTALFGDSIGTPLLSFSVSILVLSLIFRLLPHGVFYSWLSFAKYFLVGVVVLIVLTPVADNSILNFDREFMSLLLAGIFLGVSLILIIYKQLRRES